MSRSAWSAIGSAPTTLAVAALRTVCHRAPRRAVPRRHRARPLPCPVPLGRVVPAALVQHLADGAREGDDVADVAHRRRVEHEALEADAEARVRLRACSGLGSG